MVPMEATLYTCDGSIKWQKVQTNAGEGIVLSHNDAIGEAAISVAATVG